MFDSVIETEKTFCPTLEHSAVKLGLQLISLQVNSCNYLIIVDNYSTNKNHNAIGEFKIGNVNYPP